MLFFEVHSLYRFLTMLTTCSLALVDGSSLVIGSVDQIQMLHIETIPLGESVRLVQSMIYIIIGHPGLLSVYDWSLSC